MLTQHARKRIQQRAIPQVVIDLLLDFGVVEHRNKGLEILYFNKKGRHAARSSMKNSGLTQLDHCLNAFMLESSEGLVVTVGHWTKKYFRN